MDALSIFGAMYGGLAGGLMAGGVRPLPAIGWPLILLREWVRI